MVPDDFAHLHVAYPVQGISYHSGQQYILSAVSSYTILVPDQCLSVIILSLYFHNIVFLMCQMTYQAGTGQENLLL